ncbi:hypothetical protein L7F22_044954 [Adiantum nelumboides]|nr:hypothetical protein [Adiantum nelumboides]
MEELDTGWEELRREARKLEGDLDLKLSSYAKLGGMLAHGGYMEGSPSTDVGGDGSWKSMEVEIDALLKRLLDVNDAMSRCAAEAAHTTSVTQKLARHRDILHEYTQGVAAQPIPILPPPSLPDPPASPVITPSTSHPVPPIQPPDVSPDHALSDSDFDLDVADATPEVDLAPPRREKRIPGWLYSTVASSGVTELPVPPPTGLPRPLRASSEDQSNPSTSGDAGGDHNEDFGNEYGQPRPTQAEQRKMERCKLIDDATNMMLFAKDPKLTKYMTEISFQDVHAQWKQTTTSPPKPAIKKQYSEKELEEVVDARLAQVFDAQRKGKRHGKKRKKGTDFPSYLGRQSTFDKAKKHKKHVRFAEVSSSSSSSSSSSDSSADLSEEDRKGKKQSKKHDTERARKRRRSLNLAEWTIVLQRTRLQIV